MRKKIISIAETLLGKEEIVKHGEVEIKNCVQPTAIEINGECAYIIEELPIGAYVHIKGLPPETRIKIRKPEPRDVLQVEEFKNLDNRLKEE